MTRALLQTKTQEKPGRDGGCKKLHVASVSLTRRTRALRQQTGPAGPGQAPGSPRAAAADPVPGWMIRLAQSAAVRVTAAGPGQERQHVRTEREKQDSRETTPTARCAHGLKY